MRKDVRLYLFLFCISGHAVGREINSDDDKSSGIAFLSLGSGLAISGVSAVLSALLPIAAIGYFVYDYANNSKKAKEAKEAKEKQLQEQIEANQRRANEEQRLQQLQKEHQRMLEQEALNNQLRAKEQLLNESLKMIDSIPFKASSDQDFLPMQHGPFSSWEMPIYIDTQGRYCSKISCKILEQESNSDVANPNLKPKVSEFLAESAWAVFDKAGEFLFEQNEDGSINYAATAYSFGLMALQMYISGGLGPILSMADKQPGYVDLVKNFIVSSWSKIFIQGAVFIALVKQCKVVNECYQYIKETFTYCSDCGNFFSGLSSFKCVCEHSVQVVLNFFKKTDMKEALKASSFISN